MALGRSQALHYPTHGTQHPARILTIQSSHQSLAAYPSRPRPRTGTANCDLVRREKPLSADVRRAPADRDECDCDCNCDCDRNREPHDANVARSPGIESCCCCVAVPTIKSQVSDLRSQVSGLRVGGSQVASRDGLNVSAPHP